MSPAQVEALAQTFWATLSLEMAKSAAVVTWENLSEEMRLATRLGIEAAVQTYMTEMLAK